ncbi:MAG TPA: DNA gyrase C-terminal beta-propeller domain-containing protein [Candidatus Kapabacteria bacterium]|nr:DNA gyrase C-terminal beta-propeller domain-containing protein [Candidatus Kapabacteria bacterium]
MKEIANEKDDIVVVTTKGMVIRSHVADIRVMGRNTQGVRLMRLDEGDSIAGVALVPSDEEDIPAEKNQEKLKL